MRFFLLFIICGHVLWPFRRKTPPKDPKKGLSKLKQRISDIESDLRRVRSDGIDTHERLSAAIARWSARQTAAKKVLDAEEVTVTDLDAVNEAIKEGTYKG